MREKAIQFGRSAVLTGILSQGESGGGVNSRRAFVLLNSGILHRVGSCRLHVHLARALADVGCASLRFDFSGIGDSEPRRDSLSFEESSRVEVREAMDYLEQSTGVREFVLMGLCSGADMAHLTAVEDKRVRGLVFIDAWAYRTRRYWYHHYAQRLFKPEVWRNWATIRVRRILGEVSARRSQSESTEVVSYEVPKYVREFPPREKVAAELAGFVERGIQIYAIFTGGLADHYNHQAQYRSSFAEIDFGQSLRVDFMPDSDHIITNLSHQTLVVSRVVEWAGRFATPASQPRVEVNRTAAALSSYAGSANQGNQ